MRKGKFAAKNHAWKRLRFLDTWEIMAPETLTRTVSGVSTEPQKANTKAVTYLLVFSFKWRVSQSFNQLYDT